MSATLAPVLKHRFFDSSGGPLAGGKLYSYVAGTSTPASTYTDQAGLTANANPTILDANGECDLWLGSGTYKFVLKDSLDATQWTVDDVAASGTTEPATSPWIEYAVTDGQAATALSEEVMDFADHSSALYDVEIIRGTTVFSNGQIAIQNVNGAGRVVAGSFIAEEAHGVTFSVVNTSGTIWQLRAALDTGAGSGTLKLYRRLLPA